MSKGGSSTQSTQIPEYLENALKQNLNRANDVSQIGYTPYYGPDVAALSPMQQQSMQSTGNAASAFGLAPQGFDAMAGMPQAQTFANGLQGYSSAPLYQESVDQLQANRPAQFQAMADMFTDPFTGAAAKNNYQASPEQVQQMFSNSGGGGGGITPTGGNRSGNNDGEYFGVNSQYNPYGYNTPTENISGEKDRLADYRDMSFGEGGRRDIGFGENVGNFIKNITPIGTIERGIDYGQGLADGFTPSPFDNGLLSQTSGPSMTQAEAFSRMNEAARNYMPTLPQTTVNERESTYSNGQSLLDNISWGGSNPIPPEQQIMNNNLSEQYGLYGAGQNFSSANTPTSKVEQADNRIVSDSGKGGGPPIRPLVRPDRSFPRAVTEDLSLKAEAKPYKSGSKTPKKRKARTARAGYSFGL
jgi:hypothetical protein